MIHTKFSPSRIPPLDLLIIPLIVLLCFYFVGFQVENASPDLVSLLESHQNENQVNFEVALEKETKILHMRRAPANPSYPLAASGYGMTVGYMNLPEAAIQPTNETYQQLDFNGTQLTSEKSVSTFSVDVDSGGYSNVRRLLDQGILPQRNQVRTEEFINYFSYDYPSPQSVEKPFTVTTNLTQSPWNKNSHLLHIGIKGFEQQVSELPNSNLVFLVDVSGSMQDENKLELAKRSLRLLVQNLRKDDRISLVTYARNTQVVLSSIDGRNKALIMAAIDSLGAGGSTAGESGLKLAYMQAQQGFIKDGNNRIIMMTDGDFNVGLSGVDEMVRLVERKRDAGVFLSTVGFGSGNYREDMMEQMADHGNGIYFYIDSYREALRVFERNLRSNLFAIAKDVKIQVEFNPTQVSEYRLVGYENRLLKREDFNNDKVDAGDIGQGHSVTALYEITFSENKGKIEPNRYNISSVDPAKTSPEIAFLKLRYKPLGSDNSRLLNKVVTRKVLPASEISLNFKTAIVAASFAELLRDSQYLSRKFDYSKLESMINKLGDNQSAEMLELYQLVAIAQSLE